MKTRFSLSSVLIVFVFSIGKNALAQKSSINYNLSDYKLPYFKRHVLDFSTNMRSNIGTYRNIVSYPDSVNSDQGKRSTSHTSIGFVYSYHLNSDNWQVNQNLISQPSFTNSSYKEENRFRKKLGFDNYLYSQGVARYYPNSNTFFIGIGNSIRYEPSRIRETNDYSSEPSSGVIETLMKNDSYSLNTNLSIESGIGRIENVEDARLAVYILDDLNKAGKLKYSPSKNDVEILAKKISELQNERFFDSRIKKINDIKELDSVLISLGLIEDSDVTSTSIIYDNWDFADGPVRKSGSRFTVKPSVSYKSDFDKEVLESTYYDNEVNTRTELSDIKKIGILASIKYQYNKPLNLFWQLDFNSTVQFTGQKTLETLDDNMNNTWIFDIEAMVSVLLSYFPNSRTSLGLKSTYHYGNFDYQQIIENLLSNRFLSGINANYYISPRSRLELSLGYNLNHTYKRNDLSQPFDDSRKYDSGTFYGLISYKYQLI